MIKEEEKMKKFWVVLALLVGISSIPNVYANEKRAVHMNVTESTSTDAVHDVSVYRERMREFIKELRANTSSQRMFITQNGNELYFDDKHNINDDFFPVTNATTQESLYYGDVLKFNTATNKALKEELLSLVTPVRQHGKPVFVINYAKGTTRKNKLLSEDAKTNFVSEMLPSFNASKTYESIHPYSTKDITSLNDVENFLCLLNPEEFSDINDYYNHLKETEYDLLIIEASHNGKFFTKEQIENLKVKKSGGKRIVISYFSIGEAEDYRFYWKKSWNQNRPSWIVEENPDWEGNYVVEYWNPEWKKIIKNYQKKLDAIGVDGYLLDTVDSYYYFEDKYEQSHDQ